MVVSQELIDKFRESIEEGVQGLDLGKEPAGLYEPLYYIMELGGKRLRPLLTLLGFYTFKTTWRHIVKPALATEVFHNFTLIHDDILDNAPLRRGKPTVHEKWNINTAILSGDVMLVKAYELLCHAEDKYLRQVIEEFNTCITQVCEGQQKDMDFEQLTLVSEAQYMDMIRQKTAVLLGFSAKLGAILAGTSPHNAKLMYEFALEMGLGFQIKDDWLDVFGDAKKVGKKIGGDIVANKKTFLLVKAMELADEALRGVILNILENQTDADQKVRLMLEVYERLDISTIALNRIEEHFAKAFVALEGLYVDSPYKLKALRTFAEGMMGRQS